MAEELDIPPGIQIGSAPPGTPSFFATTKYADQYGDPLVLAEALARHSKLRAYVLHRGWPHVKGVVVLMLAHPQLYVDISMINWYLPREEFHRYAASGRSRLRKTNHVRLRRDNLARRDQAGDRRGYFGGFPQPKQKRDILYNNAARFLRFDPAGMTVR
jgi:predicted TIM-barrel fold metal-dependent hydrolase